MTYPPIPGRAPRQVRRRAFTLLELLTVIVVIGILAALLFPSFAAARRAADRASTKVQFARWASAIESFRAEYGCYPEFEASGLVNGAVVSATGEHLFHDLLAGRTRDGAVPLAGSAPAAQNRKLIAFHGFSQSEFTGPARLLGDAVGNTSMAVLVDRNLDGFIRIGGASADYAALPAVLTSAGLPARPGPADFPAEGLRAGVAFYAVDTSAADELRFVLSWR